MKKDGTLDRHLAKSKSAAANSASAAPIPPLGPPASSEPAPKLAPPMTSSSRGLPPPRSSGSMMPPAGYAPPIYNTAGGLAYPPVRLKSVGHQPEMVEQELPQQEQELEETQNGSAKVNIIPRRKPRWPIQILSRNYRAGISHREIDFIMILIVSRIFIVEHYINSAGYESARYHTV